MGQTGAMAGSTTYIIGGFLCIAIGTSVASNVRGFGDWYVKLGLRFFHLDRLATDRWVRRQRIYFGVVAVVGVVLLLVGLAKLG